MQPHTEICFFKYSQLLCVLLKLHIMHGFYVLHNDFAMYPFPEFSCFAIIGFC